MSTCAHCGLPERAHQTGLCADGQPFTYALDRSCSPKKLTRRKAVRLRRIANRWYRFARWLKRDLPLSDRCHVQAMLFVTDHPRARPLDSWGSTGASQRGLERWRAQYRTAIGAGH